MDDEAADLVSSPCRILITAPHVLVSLSFSRDSVICFSSSRDSVCSLSCASFVMLSERSFASSSKFGLSVVDRFLLCSRKTSFRCCARLRGLDQRLVSESRSPEVSTSDID